MVKFIDYSLSPLRRVFFRLTALIIIWLRSGLPNALPNYLVVRQSVLDYIRPYVIDLCVCFLYFLGSHWDYSFRRLLYRYCMKFIFKLGIWYHLTLGCKQVFLTCFNIYWKREFARKFIVCSFLLLDAKHQLLNFPLMDSVCCFALLSITQLAVAVNWWNPGLILNFFCWQ